MRQSLFDFVQKHHIPFFLVEVIAAFIISLYVAIALFIGDMIIYHEIDPTILFLGVVASVMIVIIYTIFDGGIIFLELYDRKKQNIENTVVTLYEIIERIGWANIPRIINIAFPSEINARIIELSYRAEGSDKIKKANAVMSQRKIGLLNEFLYYERGDYRNGWGKYKVKLEYYERSKILIAIHPAEGEHYPEGFAEKLQQLNETF